MIPVTQTSFYDPEVPPNEQRGNCLTAVVASLLELPIEAVPDFVQVHVDRLGSRDTPETAASEWNWWNHLQRFIAEQGHRMHYLKNVEDPNTYETCPWPSPEPGEHYTVSGISPRHPEVHHIVIYHDGEMVHDPHPDGTGLAKVVDEYHWSLRPITTP